MKDFQYKSGERVLSALPVAYFPWCHCIGKGWIVEFWDVMRLLHWMYLLILWIRIRPEPNNAVLNTTGIHGHTRFLGRVDLQKTLCIRFNIDAIRSFKIHSLGTTWNSYKTSINGKIILWIYFNFRNFVLFHFRISGWLDLIK